MPPVQDKSRRRRRKEGIRVWPKDTIYTTATHPPIVLSIKAISMTRQSEPSQEQCQRLISPTYSAALRATARGAAESATNGSGFAHYQIAPRIHARSWSGPEAI